MKRLSANARRFVELHVSDPDRPLKECYAEAFGVDIASGKMGAHRLMAKEAIKIEIAAYQGTVAVKEARKQRSQFKTQVDAILDEAKVEVTASVIKSVSLAILESEEVQHIVNGTLSKLHRLSATLLNSAERRSLNALIVRTPIGEINETHPLCQHFKVTTNEFGGSTEYKMPDKLAASKLDAQMAGELNEPGATVNLVENKSIIVVLPSAISQPRRAKVLEADYPIDPSAEDEHL